MEPVIKVEDLSKRYLIGHHQKDKYLTLRDTIIQKTKDWAKRLAHPFKASSGQPLVDLSSTEEFWALKDINFEIKQGERIGFIGHNGAGKSTLLKILSRITEPTIGTITIDGKVSSLLEVGTGFHPELSGRENIFLNGAVLGMNRLEIKKKFDEIVAFAEVEKFIDTPVKRYSSGMYVRLAFAVAAHLEPDILIVDEVLAVGDAQFQQKCLGKIEEVGKEGRTVLFVSHNMAAIQNICSRVILLKTGKIIANDETNAVVEKYLNDVTKLAEIPIAERTDRQGSGKIRFKRFYLKNEKEEKIDFAISGKFVKFVIEIERNTKDKIQNAVFSVGINDYKGNRIAIFTNEAVCGPITLPPSINTIEIIIPKLPFVQGKYTYTLYSTGNGEVLDWIPNTGHLFVETGDFYGTGRLPPAGQGSILLDYSFNI